MNPKLILGLALVLSVFILRPAPVRAEDRLWVDAKVNGQPVRLIFDTGASGPLLFKKSAERLGLKFVPPTEATGTHPNKVVVGQTEECVFDYSGNISKMRFGVFDVPDYLDYEADGMLGWGVMRNNIIFIDAARSNVVALAGLPNNVKSWQSLRLHSDDDILILELPGHEKTNTLTVDTGSGSGIAFAPDKWQAWKVEHPRQRLTLKTAYLPAAGIFVSEEAWADNISLGTLVLNNFPVSEAHSTEIHHSSCEAVLGLAALKRLQLVVDGKSGIAHLNAKNQPLSPYEHNRLGAVFAPIDLPKNDRLVAHVAPGSPAQKAGIQDGDVLQKVGDVDVTRWRDPSFASTNFWEQPKGTEYRLTLRRGLQTNVVTVKLENILGPD